MNRPEPCVLETSVGPEALDKIAAVLDRTWALHDHVPESVRIEVQIAVCEISANILEHAVDHQPMWLRMEIQVHPNQVWVHLSDDGAPAHVDLSNIRMADPMAERGRGLALAKAALGTLEYRRDAVNHWTLVSKPFE